MKPIYLFFLLLLIGCQNQDKQQNLLKEGMIQEFLQSELALEMQHRYKKVYILKNEYCEQMDCESYFKGFESEIMFISKEDAFMRNLDNWLVIEKIDDRKGIIEARNLIFRHRRK